MITPDNIPYWYQGGLVTHNNVPVMDKDGKSWNNAYATFHINGVSVNSIKQYWNHI